MLLEHLAPRINLLIGIYKLILFESLTEYMHQSLSVNN